MRNPFIAGPGGVVSADIAVTDHENEIEFYKSVLTTGGAPLWQDDLMNNKGMPVIGLGARTPEYENIPMQWMPHFQVADVATSVQRAIELGGRELIHSKTEGGISQWAGLADPGGAAFGVIPAVPSDYIDHSQSGTMGRIAWLSLHAGDASASCDFYKQVLGWEANAGANSTNFEMMADSDTSVAEIRQRVGEQNRVPEAWLIHLPVDDFAESLRRVQQGGGEIVAEYSENQSAIIQDPIGVYFAIQAESN